MRRGNRAARKNLKKSCIVWSSTDDINPPVDFVPVPVAPLRENSVDKQSPKKRKSKFFEDFDEVKIDVPNFEVNNNPLNRYDFFDEQVKKEEEKVKKPEEKEEKKERGLLEKFEFLYKKNENANTLKRKNFNNGKKACDEKRRKRVEGMSKEELGFYLSKPKRSEKFGH